MDDVAECVVQFLRWERDHPLPPDAPTRAVLADLRARLDASNPEWRWQVYQGGAVPFHALVIELHVGARVVRAALVQCPSNVAGEAA